MRRYRTSLLQDALISYRALTGQRLPDSRLFLPELKKSKRCPHLSRIIQGSSGFEPARPVPNHVPHYRFTANDCCRCLSKPGHRPFGQPAALRLRPKHCHVLHLPIPAVRVLLFTITFYRFKKAQSRKKSCEQLIVRNFSASIVFLLYDPQRI